MPRYYDMTSAVHVVLAPLGVAVMEIDKLPKFAFERTPRWRLPINASEKMYEKQIRDRNTIPCRIRQIHRIIQDIAIQVLSLGPHELSLQQVLLQESA